MITASGCSALAEQDGNSVPGSENVDKMLTSNSLRALSGSISRWSLASSWTYNGGDLASPFNQDRPNIAGASATTTKTDFDGSLMGKYNFDGTHSLLAGFGLRYIAPFNAVPGPGYGGRRFDVMNPFAIYQYIYTFAGFQAVLQTKALQWTQSDQTANGYAQQFAIDQETMYPVGKTGLSLALSSVLVYNTFSKNNPALAPTQSQYQVQFSPYIEYKINDRYNLRTSLNLFIYEHYRSGPQWVRDTVIQSAGLGIAVRRDIFLYPNISFLPLDLAPSRTNVSLQLTLNLF